MSEEETELRDLVAQTLENNGVLSRIRAELRASVFLALEEQESSMDSPKFTNGSLKTFLSSSEGSLITCLVREFLEYFELDFTLSVFDPETSQGKVYNYGGRERLINDLQDLQIGNLNGKKGPLLVQVLQTALSKNMDSNVKKDVNKENNMRNVSSILENESSKTSLQCNNYPKVEDKTFIAQNNVDVLKEEVKITKANSTKTVETRPLSFSTDVMPKNEINKVPRLKDVLLPATEELSPRSISISETDQRSHSYKEISKSKTESLEITPHNSPTPEQSFTQTKPESQITPTSDSAHKSESKNDSTKRKPQQSSKPNLDPITKAATSTNSSLGNLPPLMGVNFSKQSTTTFPATSQSKDIHQIKAIIDFGLDSQDNNYDEDFNSSASVSVKEDNTHQGTDTEIEEDLGSGVDDLLSSASALDDMTADVTLSQLTGIGDYMEDVKQKEW